MRSLWPLATIAVLAGCASTMKVQTQYNPQTDFAQYTTYAWNPTPPGSEQAPAARDPAIRSMIIQAIDQQMAAKGLIKVPIDANPSFIATILGWSQQKIQVTNYGYAYAGSYVYGPFGPDYVYGAPATEVTSYRVGTLVLDFADATTKTLFWRGIASDTVDDPGSVPSKIDQAAKELLKNYPPPKPK